MSAPRTALLGVALIATIAAAQAVAARAALPQAGNYNGRTTADASGKPRSISFKVKKSGCATAAKTAYCVVVDPESLVQAKCATSGLMYNAFFPVSTPIPIPPSGKIDHVYTLYVSQGTIYLTRTSGAVPSGKLWFSLLFDGKGGATGDERVSVDLREGDGVCDSGTVKITAAHG
jgi:hypothetical protein